MFDWGAHGGSVYARFRNPATLAAKSPKWFADVAM